jgi:DNA polymerase-3 subunit gamma/tau
MAYQSLYRRYRPRRFGEIRGQAHVVRALRNAVAEDRVGHAYLFSGPRGTGKTTSARILAKVLNCERPVEGEPCCECASCLAVEAGTSFDVHELDAASNNGVDDIRELIAKAMLGTPGRHKVYILDEVHMLSKAAEAALLKTLEEPPPHVVFVLATTDPQKVSETIRSRTQHLEFHLLPAEVLDEYVRFVIADAVLAVPPDAVEAVVRLGRGSARDTLSALDQVVAAGGVLPEAEPLDDVVEALVDADTGKALRAVAVAVQAGRDPRTLTEHLVAHLRDAFLSLLAPDLVQLPDRTAAVVADQARRLGPASTVRAIEVLGETLVDIRHAPDPRLLLDVALVRLTNTAADVSPSALLARIERLERGAGRSDESARAAIGPEPARDRPVVGTAPSDRASTSERAVRPPADEAPAAVAVARSGRAQLGARARRESGPSEPVGDTGRSASTATVVAPAADTASQRARVPAGGGLPSRDELTLVWADQVVPRLKPTAKAYFMAGRWVEGDGAAAVFALPNEVHRAKCEPLRADVEAALSAQFGRPVPLRLVVDEGQPASAADEPRDDEVVDLTELVDAPAFAEAPSIERVAQAFPGAELIDET